MSEQNTRRAVDIGLLRQSTGATSRTTPVIMRQVIIALLPGIVLYAYLIDARVLLGLTTAVIAALLFDAMVMWLRKRPVTSRLGDGSAAVTGVLLALSVPPGLPAWQLIIGCGVAIMLAKHVFGGLGHNPFNPAMVAFAVLVVSFPVTMTDWPMTADPVARVSLGDPAGTWDAMTSQTPLDRHRAHARIATGDTAFTLSSPGTAWVLIALAWLGGGLWLLWMRVITWHAPVALLVSLGTCHGLATLISPTAMPIGIALLGGATLFGAFFIVTDPVSGAATPRGRLLFGAGVGLLTFLIRQFGSWPEGFAFAVLIMNAAVPLIDRLDRPRTP